MRKFKEILFFLGLTLLSSLPAKAIPEACYPNSQFSGELKTVPNLCDLRTKGHTKEQCAKQSIIITELHGPQWVCFWNNYRTDCELSVYSSREPACSTYHSKEECNEITGCIWFPWK